MRTAVRFDGQTTVNALCLKVTRWLNEDGSPVTAVTDYRASGTTLTQSVWGASNAFTDQNFNFLTLTTLDRLDDGSVGRVSLIVIDEETGNPNELVISEGETCARRVRWRQRSIGDGTTTWPVTSSCPMPSRAMNQCSGGGHVLFVNLGGGGGWQFSDNHHICIEFDQRITSISGACSIVRIETSLPDSTVQQYQLDALPRSFADCQFVTEGLAGGDVVHDMRLAEADPAAPVLSLSTAFATTRGCGLRFRNGLVNHFVSTARPFTRYVLDGPPPAPPPPPPACRTAPTVAAAACAELPPERVLLVQRTSAQDPTAIAASCLLFDVDPSTLTDGGACSLTIVSPQALAAGRAGGAATEYTSCTVAVGLGGLVTSIALAGGPDGDAPPSVSFERGSTVPFLLPSEPRPACYDRIDIVLTNGDVQSIVLVAGIAHVPSASTATPGDSTPTTTTGGCGFGAVSGDACVANETPGTCRQSKFGWSCNTATLATTTGDADCTTEGAKCGDGGTCERNSLLKLECVVAPTAKSPCDGLREGDKCGSTVSGTCQLNSLKQLECVAREEGECAGLKEGSRCVSTATGDTGLCTLDKGGNLVCQASASGEREAQVQDREFARVSDDGDGESSLSNGVIALGALLVISNGIWVLLACCFVFRGYQQHWNATPRDVET